MNLAVSSLVIFILVSPAILARRLYYTKEFSREYTSRNTLTEIFSSIFLCVPLHSLWIAIFCLIGYWANLPKINFDFVFKLLFSPDKVTDFSYLTNYFWSILLYFFSLAIFSALAGYWFKSLVRTRKFDRKWDILQYDNKWNYLFNGEVVDIKKYKSTIKFEDIGGTLVDVMVKVDEPRIIYTGLLRDFQLKDNNSLDYLILESVIKATYQNQKEPQNEEIDSHYFIIPYEEIRNINIRYMAVLPVNVDLKAVP